VIRGALAAALLAGAAAAEPPRFVEEAAAAGIAHAYDGPWEHFVGGGAAAFDCDGDRAPDLLLAGGANPAALFVNRSAPRGPLRFEARALPLSEREIRGVTGAYPIDLDDDGRKDVALLRVGRDILLKGGPDCAFERADARFGFDGGNAWTTAFAAAWEDGAAHPTLAFGGYVDRAAPGAPWRTCHDNALLRPEAGPRWPTVTPLSPGHCALSMLFTDWAGDGRLSLRVSNDRQYHIDGEEQLWRVEPGRPPRLYGRADGWRRLSIWGMGIAEADLDADGAPEYALTSMGDTKLQTLARGDDEGLPVYEDQAFARGATAHRPYAGGDLRPSTGWHAAFADVNNDALLDLFIAKGNVEEMPDFAAVDPDNLLIGRWDGGFAEGGEAAGIALPTRGRGAAVADFNADGMLDLLVVNRAGPASLFRNLGWPRADGSGHGPMGNWLKVELRQPPPNRDAVGAVLSLRVGDRVVTRRVTVGGGHASGALGWVHLGMGTAPRAELRVRWPDGRWSHPYRLFANQHAVIDRGAAEARYWRP
jgi:hypothetical protein